jgi:hypothetical protein
MSMHQFDRPSLYLDYTRAAFGLAVTAGPLLLLDLLPVIAWPFALLALLFAWFGVRTLVRHLSRVELSASRIALEGPLPRSVAWEELREVRLAYFAPRRAHGRGWLQLTLRGRSRRPLRLESTLDGFEDVLRCVRQVVATRELPLDPTTASNFAAVGMPTAGHSNEDPDAVLDPRTPITERARER